MFTYLFVLFKFQ